jgi:hypothetical protein
LSAMPQSETVSCFRCGEPIKWAFVCDDNTDAWADKNKMYACSDFHGHDEHGAYFPMHSPVDDGDRTIVKVQ